MYNKFILVFLLLIQCYNIIKAQHRLPYILDMVHNNPGETAYITKYNNPSFLKTQGFTGTVPHWHINCAITYDNYGNILQDSEKEWIERKAFEIEKKIEEFHSEGIEVFPFTDFIIFPQSIWKKYAHDITYKNV